MNARLTQGPIFGRVMLLSVLITATVAIPMAIFGVATVQIVSTRLTQRSLEDVRLGVQTDADTLTHALDRARIDLNILRELTIRKLARAQAAADQADRTRWFDAIGQAYLTISTGRRTYSRIRYLDQSGREVIRVDDDGVRPPQLVPKERLQDKRQRPYFTETMTLPPEGVYISPPDLTQDRDRIEIPHRPTVRYAAPLFDDAGRRRGIVIADLRLGPLLDAVYQQAKAAQKQVYIVDQDGFYLLHPDPARQWGSPRHLNTGEWLQRDFPDLAARLLSGEPLAMVRGDMIVAAQPLRLGTRPTAPFLTVIEELPVAAAQATATDARLTLLLLLIASCGAAIAGAVLIGNRMAQPLYALALAADRIGQGELPATTMAVSGPHEIRTLTTAFNAMTIGLIQARGRIARHLATLKLINEIAQTAGRDLSFEQVLDCALDTMLSLPNVEASELYLWNPSRTEVVLRGSRGMAQEAGMEIVRFAPGRGLPGLAAAADEIMIITDLPTDRRVLRRSLIDAGFQTYIAIPLRGRGSSIGVLTAFSRTHLTLTDEEQATLPAIGATLAMAMSNARLFDAQRRVAEQLAEKVDELDGKMSELEQTQARLIEAERLRMIGQMAAGVAHDFNNALMTILGQAQLIRCAIEQGAVADVLRRIESYADLLAHLSLQEQAILDAAEIVRKIREAGRPREEDSFAPVSLNEIVAQVIEVTRPRWDGHAALHGIRITLAKRLDEAPPIFGNAAELRETLTNLLFNALDAMPRGGVLTIGLRHDAGGSPTMRGWIDLTVTDTGIGMSPEVRTRLFEPFFTTKGVHGTGLGLSMVYGIVRRHGGEIRVASDEGWGTVITIRLPAAPTDTALAPSPIAVSPALGRLRLLVIDDEPALGETLAELLRQLGHEATTAGGGEAGLAALQAERVDLVMTDLGMPGMSGWEVARAVKAHRPALPVILVSGWGSAMERDQLEGTGVDLVMAKPYTMTQLKQILSQATALLPHNAGNIESG